MRRSAQLLRMSYLVASIGGVGFFALSVLVLGVWPGRVLEEQTRRMSPDHPLGLSASEERGRLIYSREGCAYCHTQQIRYLAADVSRLGAPTLAWVVDPSRGTGIYVRNCADGHGARGEGEGAGAPGLHPRPVNLAAHEYTLDRLGFALWNGVVGPAMPAWRDLSQSDLSAVAD